MNGTNTRQGRCTDELYHPLFVWTFCVCVRETADSAHKVCVEIKWVYMWFYARLPVWMTEQSAVASTGEIYTLLLTCNLPATPPPPIPTSHHLNSPHPPSFLYLETEAEGLAPPWWLHPGPVDSNPSGVFQDVRHEAPQTYLLKASHAGCLRTWSCRRGASTDGILEARCSLWQAYFP